MKVVSMHITFGGYTKQSAKSIGTSLKMHLTLNLFLISSFVSTKTETQTPRISLLAGNLYTREVTKLFVSEIIQFLLHPNGQLMAKQYFGRTAAWRLVDFNFCWWLKRNVRMLMMHCNFPVTTQRVRSTYAQGQMALAKWATTLGTYVVVLS